MFRPTPRDAICAGLGALALPLGMFLGYRIAGRHELDPSYRSENHQ